MQKIEEKLEKKVKINENLINFFKNHQENPPKESIKYKDMLKRVNIDIFDINKEFNLFDEDYNLLEKVNIKIKYEGYLKQQEEDIQKTQANEKLSIPADFSYENIKGLRKEAIEKLEKIRPLTIAQASRISGVSPADISILTILVKNAKKDKKI